MTLRRASVRLLDGVSGSFLRVVESLEALGADVLVPAASDSLDPGRGQNPNVLHQPRERALVLRESVALGVDAHPI